MQFRSARFIGFLVALLMVVGLCLVDAGAQKRRRHVRRPGAAKPSPTPDSDSTSGDPQVISTADQSTQKSSTGPKRTPTPAPESEQEALRRKISELSDRFNKVIDKMEEQQRSQRSLVDIERLSLAEQRAETFRAQLRDVQAKQTDLQIQLDQVEDALRPESIERAVGLYGTTHPEVAREQRRHQLESQRTRLKTQADQLEQSRVHLEAAIATVDTEVDKLRAQVETNNQQPNQPGAATPQPATPEPTPTPSETPPQK